MLLTLEQNCTVPSGLQSITSSQYVFVSRNLHILVVPVTPHVSKCRQAGFLCDLICHYIAHLTKDSSTMNCEIGRKRERARRNQLLLQNKVTAVRRPCKCLLRSLESVELGCWDCSRINRKCIAGDFWVRSQSCEKRLFSSVISAWNNSTDFHAI